MINPGISRKDFIRNSALGVAGVAVGSGFLNAEAAAASPEINQGTSAIGKNYTLKNVRLETGFEYEGEEVVHTNTGLFCVAIAEGKIKAVLPNQPHSTAFDAKGLLMLPAKANMAAQLYGHRTEFELSRILKLATHNILPLSDTGVQQWPKPGDLADLVLVDAGCSAEAVSRISPVRLLIHRGNIVYS